MGVIPVPQNALPHSSPSVAASPELQKNFGIVVFPGSWSDGDCHHALGNVLGQHARYLWHKEDSFSDVDCIILPGGFSYGDYLRPGAIARLSPIMDAITRFAAPGRPRPRHLQRLPDALRSRAPPRRPHAQQPPPVPLPVDPPPRRTKSNSPFTRTCTPEPGPPHPHLPRRRQLLRRSPQPSNASNPKAASSSATAPPQAKSPANPTPTAPSTTSPASPTAPATSSA